MKWSNDFQDFLESLDEDEYVGLGNPDAKILFIGKELKGELNTVPEEGKKKDWLRREARGYRGENYFDSTTYNSAKATKNPTWWSYQKLYQRIFKSSEEKNNVSFVENVFTTELSSLPAPKTDIAVKHPNFKSELERRKQDYWAKSFITKQFPVTFIFGSGNKYITYDREIFDMFQIPFKDSVRYKNHKIDLHCQEGDNPRLLIRTCQLVRTSDKFLEKIAKVVRVFAKKNNIDLKIE